MVLTHSEATHLTAHMERKQKTVHRFGMNAPYAGLSCRLWPAEQKHTTPNNGVSHLNRATAVWKFFFVDSQHLSRQTWTGHLTNKLSLCFHSDLWMGCASACDNQMPRKTRLVHEKPVLCRKPVITAIIQLDLICIIKLCYCLTLEATASLCSH